MPNIITFAPLPDGSEIDGHIRNAIVSALRGNVHVVEYCYDVTGRHAPEIDFDLRIHILLGTGEIRHVQLLLCSRAFDDAESYNELCMQSVNGRCSCCDTSTTSHCHGNRQCPICSLTAPLLTLYDTGPINEARYLSARVDCLNLHARLTSAPVTSAPVTSAPVTSAPVTNEDLGICHTNNCDEAGEFMLSDQSYCQQCYIDTIHELTCCSECSSSNRVRLVHGSPYCRDCANSLFSQCHCCGDYYDESDIRTSIDNHTYCDNCHRPEWHPSKWAPNSNTFSRVHRSFTFGVEIETSRSNNYKDLENNTNWGCVREASTEGREFVSPVLCGDAGLAEICKFVGKWGADWRVDRHCGTHIHIGLQNYDLEQCRKVAFAYRLAWPILANLVGESRSLGGMAGSPQWVIADLMAADDMHDFAADRDKFEYINWRPLVKMGTVEIRSLPGNLNVDLINYWIRWHCKFIRTFANMSWSKLEGLWTNPEIAIDSVDIDLLHKLQSYLGTMQDWYPDDDPYNRPDPFMEVTANRTFSVGPYTPHNNSPSVIEWTFTHNEVFDPGDGE